MSTNDHHELSQKKAGKVIPLHGEKSETCIFCGQKVHLESFKGKPICTRCRQSIPTLFSYG